MITSTGIKSMFSLVTPHGIITLMSIELAVVIFGGVVCGISVSLV
jgi:hypothetical protein